MEMGKSSEELKKLVLDKLSEINFGNQYEPAELVLEKLFDDLGLRNVFADDSTFSVYYKIANKDGEKSIVELKYSLTYGIRRIIDIDILWPFEKMDISSIENTKNHVLLTTENGSGIYNLSERRFELEIGQIPDINKVVCMHFVNPLGFLIDDPIAFLISNNDHKKGIYVPHYENLSTSIRYDEVCPNYCIKHRNVFRTIFTVTEGNKTGLLMYRYHPIEEDFEIYGDDYVVMDDDFYYDQMELLTLPTFYDAIEISDFQDKGAFKANIDQEQYVIASVDGYEGRYVVHRVINSQILPVEEVSKTLVKVGERKTLH